MADHWTEIVVQSSNTFVNHKAWNFKLISISKLKLVTYDSITLTLVKHFYYNKCRPCHLYLELQYTKIVRTVIIKYREKDSSTKENQFSNNSCSCAMIKYKPPLLHYLKMWDFNFTVYTGDSGKDFDCK